MNKPVERKGWKLMATGLVLALAFSAGDVTAAKPKRPAPAHPVAPAAPVTSLLEDEMPEAKAVLAALENSEYKLTPEAKAAFLAWRKVRAIAAIAKTGQSLPKDFLEWVDSDPVVAGTVYGIADNSAQRLVLLRSLELDVGAEEVRKKHLQLALGITDAQAGKVNPETMSNDAQGISLKERGLLKLEIKRYPCVKVDTHPKDRPLDMNDHIINFLEDNPVITERKVMKEVGGQQVETVVTNSRPLHAYEVYTNPARLKKFNEYMTGVGFKMNLDCGKGQVIPAHWGGGRDVTKAYKLFRTAYEAKGRLPKGHDPSPTPGELAAYLIRNDNFRFPEGVKRGWPKFPLNARWPVLYYLVGGGESLREREFVWDRFCKVGSVVGYGAYVGPIAQYPDLLKARKLQPFDFPYDTYPMRLKDGGVCGTCSNIGRFSQVALGIPAGQASQPSHSCFVAVGGNEQRGYGLSIGQAVAGPGSTFVSGHGRYLDDVIKFYPINYGLLPYLDARIALEVNRLLPAVTPAKSRLALLESAFEINPYNLQAATTVLSSISSPVELMTFWKKFTAALAAVEKPGCPKSSTYNTAVQKVFDSRLAQLSPPSDKTELDAVLASLAGRADALWLKYQLAAIGLPALKEKLAADLKASIAGPRTPQSCSLLSGRLLLVGGAIKDVTERKTWADQLLDTIGDKTMYTFGEGKKTREVTDSCAITLRNLVGNSPDARAGFEADLKTAVEGSRTAAGCDLLGKRLEAIATEIKNPKERAAWGDTLLAIMDDHELFAPPNAPTTFTVDPLLVKIYALGCDLAPARTKFEADLKASVAGTRTVASSGILAQRLATLARGITPAKERKLWAEALLPIVEGKEGFSVSVKLPKNKGVRQVEAEDPCAVQIYGMLGKKTPAQVKAIEARKAAVKPVAAPPAGADSTKPSK